MNMYLKKEIDECCIYGNLIPQSYEIVHEDAEYIILSDNNKYHKDEIIYEDDLIHYIFSIVDSIKILDMPISTNN